MVLAVTSGTPPQEIFKDATEDTGYTRGGGGLMAGSSRDGISSGGRRRRAGVGGGGGGEGQQYPALVERAVATLMKVWSA